MSHQKYLNNNDTFNFFSDDLTKWNYNHLLINNEIDIYNNNRKFRSGCYNGMKHNIIIYFKELLKIISEKKLFDYDLFNYIHDNLLTNINKVDYYKLLSYFFHCLVYLINNYDKNTNKVNYKEFRKYFLKLPARLTISQDEEQKLTESQIIYKDIYINDKNYSFYSGKIFYSENMDTEVKYKVSLMLKYLYKFNILGFGAGIYKLK